MVRETTGIYKGGVCQIRLFGEVNGKVLVPVSLPTTQGRIFRQVEEWGRQNKQSLRAQKPHRCVAGA